MTKNVNKLKPHFESLRGKDAQERLEKILATLPDNIDDATTEELEAASAKIRDLIKDIDKGLDSLDKQLGQKPPRP